MADIKIHYNRANMELDRQKETEVYHKFLSLYERRQIMKELHLDEQDADKWIVQNDVLFRTRLKKHKEAVALARFGSIQNILSDAQHSNFLLNSRSKQGADTKKVSNIAAQTYEKIGTEFYGYLQELIKNGLPKVQDGTALIRRTIDLDGKLFYQHTSKGVSLSYDALKEANQNIWEKGKFAVLDLETLGGYEQGHQKLDAITEFSFGIADTDGKIKTHYGSIVGIGTAQHRRFTDIIHKYETGGDMSDRETVILKRLAKMGNKKTAYRQINGADGIFEYNSFAGDADIKDMNTRDMRRGADELLGIYKAQNDTKATYRGKSVLAWEKQLIEGMRAIKTQDLTVVGHNSAAFDVPMLERFIESGQLSSNATEILEDRQL